MPQRPFPPVHGGANLFGKTWRRSRTAIPGFPRKCAQPVWVNRPSQTYTNDAAEVFHESVWVNTSSTYARGKILTAPTARWSCASIRAMPSPPRLPVDLSALQKLTAPGERLAAVGWNVACSYRCEDGNIDFGGPALRPPAKLICLCRLAGLREPPSDPRLRRQ